MCLPAYVRVAARHRDRWAAGARLQVRGDLEQGDGAGSQRRWRGVRKLESLCAAVADRARASSVRTELGVDRPP